MIKKRFLSMLVLLMAVAAGVVAQNTYTVTVEEGTDEFRQVDHHSDRSCDHRRYQGHACHTEVQWFSQGEEHPCHLKNF